MKNVTKIHIDAIYQFKNYDWLKRVESITVESSCTPEIFDSGKLTSVVYEPWMDIDKCPNATYVFASCIPVDPRIRNLNLMYDSAVSILEQLADVELDHFIFGIRSNQSFVDYFKYINCKKLTYHNKDLEGIIGLNRFKNVHSTSYCSAETVENNTSLIDGSFRISGMDATQSFKFLNKVFTRNRRYCKTKSAK